MVQVIAFVMLCVVLAIAAGTDWRHGKIYNWLVLPAMLVGLLYWTFAGLIHDGASGALSAGTRSGIALLAGLVPFTVLFLIGGIGGGDAKLMGAVGAISGDWRCVLATAIYAVAFAFIMAIVAMVRHGVVRRTLTTIYTAVLSSASRVQNELPTDSPRIAFGVAIAVAGVLAGAEHLLHTPLPWSLWGH